MKSIVSWRDHLTRHHDRKTWRVGDDKIRRNKIGPLLQPPVHLRWSASRMCSQLAASIGGVETAADVAFIRPLAGVLAKGVVEAGKVRQVRDVGHQALHPRLEGLTDVGADLGEALFDLVADFHQDADPDGRRRCACC